jgi:probable phosphoglycerate mutase
MKLLFARHGETDWNAQGKIQGSRDIPLNSTGIEQSNELARAIQREHPQIRRIFSSTQQRAMQTARIVADTLGLDFATQSGLEEINFGLWEGLSWPEVRQRYPAEYTQWFASRRHTAPPGGESYQALLDRVRPAVRAIRDTHDEDLAIVTHGGVLLALQCLFNETPFEEMTKYKAENTAILALNPARF